MLARVTPIPSHRTSQPEAMLMRGPGANARASGRR